jgi:hypothetical protein
MNLASYLIETGFSGKKLTPAGARAGHRRRGFHILILLLAARELK